MKKKIKISVLVLIPLLVILLIIAWSYKYKFTSNNKNESLKAELKEVRKERKKKNGKKTSYENKLVQLIKAARQKIKGYGRVVDLDGEPLENVNVGLEWVDNWMKEGTRKKIKTDKGGNFYFKGRGFAVEIYVYKDGYYNIKESSSEIAPNNNSSPDNPIIFKLRKRGVAEPLRKVDFDDDIKMTGEEKVIFIKGGSEIIATLNSSSSEKDKLNNNIYDWSGEIKLPGGGFIERTGGEFDFIAPESGYKESIKINMPASLGKENGWNWNTYDDYFVKFSNHVYGRLKIGMSSRYNNRPDISLIGYVNPSGSRNLEWDPKKEIKEKRRGFRR